MRLFPSRTKHLQSHLRSLTPERTLTNPGGPFEHTHTHEHTNVSLEPFK